MLNIAVRAARSAGNLIVRYVDRLDTLSVTAKKRNDFVSEVDRLAEEEIIRILRKASAVIGRRQIDRDRVVAALLQQRDYQVPVPGISARTGNEHESEAARARRASLCLLPRGRCHQLRDWPSVKTAS